MREEGREKRGRETLGGRETERERKGEMEAETETEMERGRERLEEEDRNRVQDMARKTERQG